MRLTTFGHCTQITFFPRVFPVNCYLVKENDGLTLIDAALPSNANSIRQAAQSLGLPITRILLTHGHADHVGALDRLHQRLPEAEVMISERDSRLLAGDTRTVDGEPQVKVRGGIKPCQTQPTGHLKEGDRIGNLEVICSPGHTPGHVAFLDVRDRTLIAGDAFQIQGGIAVSGTIRPRFPFPAFATWHRDRAVESARRLRDLRPSQLAVGHGNVLSSPLDAMNRAIKQAERNTRRMN
ncbi:MBL fold metallo-hydrolase [Alicyclobacillus fastidiosus]|uniref:MBL fold metallo-hydrolase n=1 Tax=Alicyclobacillus fastidiosus TaxID=392011 RepID=A0ABV5AL54_9BACL|nr:MBL fold metallo-hydrolase [Alicyclobacillus fastidiosus]WEH08871.1 MBL fold metallo-hydrolase [Alicyclobacillus fastidiosus]